MPGADQPAPEPEPEHETGAGREHVVSGGVRGPELLLQRARARRQEAVGRRGREHDLVHVGGLEPRHVERALARDQRQSLDA
jgi:hypothetical protein